MLRNRFLSLATALALGAAFGTGMAYAGDDAPVAPAAATAAKTAPETATPVEAKTKTGTPIWTVMAWVGKQVAPNLECACPATEAGEKAWRSWFDGGTTVPLASLRDQMVADGWTADRFVSHFKEMVAKKASAKGECGDCPSKCDGGKCDGAKCDGAAKCDGCPDKAAGATATASATDGGCCKGKGERADGKPCCGGCKAKKEAAAAAAAAATEAAKTEKVAEPTAKP
jgi:hypothetical protein